MMSRTIRHSRLASSGRIDRSAIYGFFMLLPIPGEQLRCILLPPHLRAEQDRFRAVLDLLRVPGVGEISREFEYLGWCLVEPGLEGDLRPVPLGRGRGLTARCPVCRPTTLCAALSVPFSPPCFSVGRVETDRCDGRTVLAARSFNADRMAPLLHCAAAYGGTSRERRNGQVFGRARASERPCTLARSPWIRPGTHRRRRRRHLRSARRPCPPRCCQSC